MSDEQLAFDLPAAPATDQAAVRQATARRRPGGGAALASAPAQPSTSASPSEPRLSAAQIAEAVGRPAPTAEQVEIIQAPLQPMLVVAGAGSGKTETMAARVVWLVANGMVEAAQVLGLTFTRKAAGELAERIRARLHSLGRVGLLPATGQQWAGDVTVSTYHSYAAALLTDSSAIAGLDAGRLISEAGAWQLVDDIAERWAGDMSQVTWARSTVTDAVVRLAAEAADHLIEPAQLDAYLASLATQIQSLPDEVAPVGAANQPGAMSAPVAKVVATLASRRQLIGIWEAFIEAKKRVGVTDFGDQVAMAAQLALGTPQLGQAERERYRVVLLDEYQDTSHAQLLMLRALFGHGHPVVAVGDPHQSIYGWRGASAGNLHRFATDFPVVTRQSLAQIQYLSTSWRNDAAIMGVANVVADPLRAGSPWAPDAPKVQVPHLAARPDAGTGSVQVHWLPTLEDEAVVVADAAQQAWREGRAAAVLCRTRSQIPLLHQELAERDVPIEVVGLGGLLEVSEVADIRAMLEVLADPGRGDSLMRLLTRPMWRIGPADIDALGAWARELSRAAEPAEPSLVEALDVLPDPSWRGGAGEQLSAAARSRLTRLGEIVRYLRSRGQLSLPELVFEIERALQLDVEVAARGSTDPIGQRAALDAFADVAADFEAAGGQASVMAFTAWLSAAQERERGLDAPVTQPRSDAVQILTVHAAKGLEWDVVIVPGLVEGGFPSGHGGRATTASNGWLTDAGAIPFALRGDCAELPAWHVAACTTQSEVAHQLEYFRLDCAAYEIQQERRLAYVAVTRARQQLVATGAVWGDGVRPRRPSVFLVEMAELAALPDSHVTCPTWTAPPTHGEVNPREAIGREVIWPTPVQVAPDTVAGADMVQRAMTELAQESVVQQQDWRRQSAQGVGSVDTVGTAGGVGEVADPWAAQLESLLAERQRRAQARAVVELPAHLSASHLVSLASDPAALALRLRRPMPSRPHPQSRRGSVFHAWLEQYFGATALFDVDDVPGLVDEETSDAELAVLKEKFLASRWSRTTPYQVEVAVETPIAGLSIRGRIDAVFRHQEGDRVRWEVVDWKTGHQPHDSHAAQARAVQLAIYRLAWSRLHSIDLSDISAAFYYVTTGDTVTAVDDWPESRLITLIETNLTTAP